MIGSPRFSVFVSCLLLSTVSAQADRSTTASLRTVEGRVIALGSHEGEGGLDLLTVALAIDGSDNDTLELMLAPDSVFAEIGFEINEGDRLRARVFVEPEGPAPVHKVQNISAGTVVRLRTLHATPLWSAAGSWQGSSIGNGPGPHRRGHRGGQGPPR